MESDSRCTISFICPFCGEFSVWRGSIRDKIICGVCDKEAGYIDAKNEWIVFNAMTVFKSASFTYRTGKAVK